MVRRLAQGAIGGDLNSIISPLDSNPNPQSKISPSCKNLVRAFSWTDSFRAVQPRGTQLSRYNRADQQGEGASRIDRSYHWGEIQVVEACYNSISFSDHLGLKVHYKLPNKLDQHLAPPSRPAFKISPTIVNDATFRHRLELSMQGWLKVKEDGAEVLLWWEYLVKGGIKNLAITRSKELKKKKT